MLTPPPDVSDDDVLAVVRTQWLPEVDAVEHLAVGFGAHHWAAYAEARCRLFVTLDHLGTHHDAVTLEATYAAAADLPADLDFVVRPIRAATGTCTIALADGALSATGWMDGVRPDDAAGALPLVRRLHAASPPAGILPWQPLVPPSFAEELAERVDPDWSAGPHGPAARAVITAHLFDVERWVAAYHRLAELARARPWVPTHGEPHERTQLLTDDGLRLVDWESLRLAPGERDLRVLAVPGADPEMVEMFDLEWRLDEIAQYAAWFESSHGGGEDAQVALGGLRQELTRP